jgi:hypothetical protein
MSFINQLDQETITADQYHAINQGLEDVGQGNPVV